MREEYEATSESSLRLGDNAARFVEKVLKKVEQNFSTVRDREAARVSAILSLRAIDRAMGFGLVLPVIYRPKINREPMCSEHWAMFDANFVFLCDDGLQRKLLVRGARGSDLAAMILLSAILRGGLLRCELWVALWDVLRVGSRVRLMKHQLFPDLFWMDLNFGAKSEEVYRFFPDVQTLSLLRMWRKEYHLEEIKSYDVLYSKLLNFLDVQKKISAKKFAQAGFVAMRDRSGASVPGVIYRASTGEIKTVSVSAPKWVAALNGDAVAIVGDRKARTSRSTMGSASSVTEYISDTEGLRALRLALQEKSPGAVKQSPAPVRRALIELLSHAHVPMIEALALWMLSLLASKRKVNTLKRYAAAIARPLVLQFSDQNPSAMEPSEIEQCVDAAFENILPRERAYAMDRIRQFFIFTYDDPRIHWPDVNFSGEMRQVKSGVRAALLSGQQVKQLLHGLKGDPILRIATLLMARAGLRVSELEALTVGDVQRGRDGVIRIHPTREGNIKTGAGRRQIPVALFLTQAEFDIWDKFVRERHLHQSRLNAPFLSDCYSLTPSNKIDRNELASALRNTIGMTPHDLRHGAISNMALVLFSPAKSRFVQVFTGFSAARIELIQEYFKTMDPQGGVLQLASLAGHRDPLTTFESYVNLTDVILGLYHLESDEVHSKQIAAKILSTKHKTLGRKQIIELESVRKPLMKRASVKIIKSSKGKQPPSPQLPELEFNYKLVVDVCKALDTLHSNEYDVAISLGVPINVVSAIKKFHPLPKISKIHVDKLHVLKVFVHLEQQGQADVWARQVLNMPERLYHFNHRNNAMRWLGFLRPILNCDIKLRVGPLGEGAWADFSSPRYQGVSTRLEIKPRAPSGDQGISLLRFAATVYLALQEAKRLKK